MTSTFAQLGVPASLVSVLERDGKTTPFPIQASTLPDSLGGRDVLGRGRTGSGKTLAFSLPVVARLATGASSGRPLRARPGRPRALILAPTRELATQIDAVIAPLAAAVGLTTTTVFGGVNQARQERAMARGADIVVACPGRLEDLMRQRIVHLDAVEVTVLDEADHMADLGFLPGVTRIMAATPASGQRLLFSATLDNGVDKLVRRFLSDPRTHSVDGAESPVEEMTHHVFHLADADAKKDVVRALASGTGRRVLFMRTKHHAKRLARQLTEDGIPAVDLHGNLSQNVRDRNLAAFAAGSAKVLVATDVAARGVHVDGIELVVHVDPPAEHKAYLHRSGRTARAGSSGDVVTLVLPEQRRDTDQLLRQARIRVTPQRVDAAHGSVTALVGEVADYVAPVAAAAAEVRRGGEARRGGASNRGGSDRVGSNRGASHGGGSRGRRGGGRGQSGTGQATGAPGSSSQRPARSAAPRAGGHSSAAAFSAAGGGRRRSR